MKERELLSSIQQCCLTNSVVSVVYKASLLCSTVHPSLVWVSTIPVCGILWTVKQRGASELLQLVFQMKRLGRTPLKAASAAQDPLLPASSPFGPCAAPSAVPPRHELGWREDANWFSASFPQWRPSSIAGTLQGKHKDTVLGHCSPASKFETRQKIRQIPPTEQGKH